MKIDAHQHFWRFRAQDYPWLDEGETTLRRDFLPEDVKSDLNALGFDGSVAVQARQSLEETRWLLELADANPQILGVIGWIDLCSSQVETQIQEFVLHPRFVGVRHVLQGEPAGFLSRADFLGGIERLSIYGLAYDLLLFPQHLSPAVEFVDRFPQQVFVLDHLGKPYKGQDSVWKNGIRELALRPQVYCKLSGMLSEQRLVGWRADDYRFQLDLVLEAFGPQRLLIGSDWPVCLTAGTYPRVMSLVLDYLSELSESEQRGILGENAAKAYRVGHRQGV